MATKKATRDGGTKANVGKKATPAEEDIPVIRRLTRAERLRVMVKTFVAERTIKRWEKGLPVTEATRQRLSKACADLGIEILRV